MPAKPSYEELERRVQALEKLESDHNHSKKALQESERLFKILYEYSPFGYQSLDENGRFIVVNQTWLDILGYTREEVIGKSFTDFLHPDWRDHFKENFPRFKSIGEILGVEFEMVKKNGDLILVSFNGKIGRDQDGRFVHTHCILDEITERRRAEKQLKESEEKFTTLIQQSPFVVEIYDLNGLQISVNKAYEELWDFPAEITLNKFNVLESKEVEETGLLEYVKRAYAGDSVDVPEYFFDPSGDTEAKGVGRRRWLNTRIYPLKDESGKVKNVVIVHQDITERKQAETALRQSEEKYRTLVDTAPFGIQLTDFEGRIVYSNPAHHTMQGYGPQELIGMHIWDLMAHDSHRVKAREYYQTIISNKPAPTVYCNRDRTRDGREIDTQINWDYIHNEKNEVTGIISIVEDITERKRAEEALRESEEKYRILFNIFPLGITVSDPSGNIVESNPRAAELLGIVKDEHETRRIDAEQWQIIRPDGTLMPATEWASVRALQENRLVENTEMGIVKSGGEITWINVTAAPLPLENYGVVITYNDITDRKAAEDALKNREYLLNKIFDVLPIGLWFADKNGKLLQGNPAGVRIWGAEPTVPMEEYGVFKARRLPSGKEIATDDWALAHTIREGATIVDELLEIDSFDGKKKIILNYTAPVLDDLGNIHGAIVVNHDITEREQLHAQLQQAQKMESVGRLAGGVAHDFNNMLGVIFGHIEMALDDVDPAAPLHASLQAIQHAAERSAALTRQLLAFARKQTIAPKVIDINETVAGMLNMLRRLIGEDIDLLWQPGENLLPVKVDPSQIDQLLANLCVNARDAIEGVGNITIETASAAFDEAYCAAHHGFVPGEYILLAVSDDGCGMDKKTLNQIFEPFFTTKEQGKGTGLGLASIYGMVKQNNGFINVYSEPGQGTTFRIYLPVYMAKSDEVVGKAPELPAERGHETILLVEDEPAILEMTTMMLERLGYSVVAAATPGEAIRLALEYRGKINLLMTDVVMPEMNGRELAGNLLSHYPDLKRLFMSGYTANVIAHHGVLDEGVHFIQKPFSMKDLGGKLRVAMKG